MAGRFSLLIPTPDSVSLVNIALSFIVGVMGAVVGAVMAAFRVDKRIALLEQKIDITIDGPVGVVVRLANIEAAINARKIPHHTEH